MERTQKKLNIIPLGGLGEIGKNMTAFRYGNDIILIDAGLMFPEDDMLGIDLVIPDITYLVENQDKLRGIFLTHGHEDHIGALPFILKQLDVPVYGTPLTLGILKGRLEEAGVSTASLNEIRSGDRVRAGVFKLEFMRVNHSIPDAIGMAIHTPVGLIVHTGDFKIDQTPVDGQVGGRTGHGAEPVCRIRGPGRAADDGGQHQRGTARLHPERKVCGRDL